MFTLQINDCFVSDVPYRLQLYNQRANMLPKFL